MLHAALRCESDGAREAVVDISIVPRPSSPQILRSRSIARKRSLRQAAASRFSRQLRPQTILHHVSHRGLCGVDVGLKCRMLQIAARRLNRLTQQYNVQGVAQVLGSMVVAEAPVKPEGMTSVHSGVAIDTNGSATNGKVANSKQVHCVGT